MSGGLGQRIRMARNLAGLSQRLLAERVGVAPGTVSNWEHGRDAPNSRYIIVLADACGVQPEFFFRTGEVELSQGHESDMLGGQPIER